MGMVVRTNTMSSNAFRQLTMNNSALSKSLEKLSSGYRINRAGDDASGLAISEKMKAQIQGLDQASSNSEDGISLVQTAEGALTEVHSMLNRMVELATKSANGTVQDDVDRDAIQTEVDALKDEITRVSKSTNFNGIQLLDGSLSSKGSTSASGTTENVTVVDGAAELKDVAAVAGEKSYKFAAALGDAAGDGAIQIDVSLSDGTTETVYAKIDSTDAQGTISAVFKNALNSTTEGNERLQELFTMDVAGDNSDADNATKFTFTNKTAGTGAVSVTGITFTEKDLASNGEWKDATAASVYDIDGTGSSNTSGLQGVVTETTASNEYSQLNFGSASVTNANLDGESVTVADKTYVFKKASDLYDVEDGQIAVALGDERTDTMANLVAALKANGVSSAEVDSIDVKIGDTDELKTEMATAAEITSTSKAVDLGYDVAQNGVFKSETVTALDDSSTNHIFTIGYVDKNGTAQEAKVTFDAGSSANATTANIAEAINADDNLKTMFKVTATDDDLSFEILGDKDGVKSITSTSDGTTSGSVSETQTAYGEGQTINLDLNKLASGDTLSVNGQSYTFVKSEDIDKVADNSTAVLIGADEQATAQNLQSALKSNGITSKIKPEGSDYKILIEADTEITATGGLTLQIGDTSDAYNKVTVSIDDLSAEGLGIDGLDVSSQSTASTSIQTIKDAINKVSTNRGNLGALQNRLEHAINNLDTTSENMDSANSRIRDTDMAKEMMNYTKMNILTQAAQAMLAQANQQPQSILQLLQ